MNVLQMIEHLRLQEHGAVVRDQEGREIEIVSTNLPPGMVPMDWTGTTVWLTSHGQNPALPEAPPQGTVPP